MTGSANFNVWVGVDIRCSALKLIVAGPSRPTFVVTRTTPFAPREPYTADAVASRKIEKFSMSSTGIRAKSSAVTSILSTRINGLLFVPKVPTPLMKKSALSPPGSPLR
ncbi:hypothetical protein D3C72_1099030 [compost metagenome]